MNGPKTSSMLPLSSVVGFGEGDAKAAAIYADAYKADPEIQKLIDVTEDFGTLSLMGPASRAILSAVTDADVTNDAFAFGQVREQTSSIDATATIALFERG